MAAAALASQTELLPADAKPPKSKTAPYYAIHPLWQDVVPIPQVDQTGALAAIAYAPRYVEAMSYLRAVMADNEISERALALTEDLIGMNPAHYTVWIYRMRILKGLWHTAKTSGSSTAQVMEVDDKVPNQAQAETSHEIVDQRLWNNVQEELRWLEAISFRNLKNYQIWHHRHALADLLPVDSKTQRNDLQTSSKQPIDRDTHQMLSEFIASEQLFLTRILSEDTKNYHVWSYRQWLCSRFPSYLLPSYASPITSIASTYRSHPEVRAIDSMIEDDIRNNSAWSHRYYLLFGHHELTYTEARIPPIILKEVNEQKLLHKAGLVDTELVQAEIEYTKDEISKSPQNPSTWNYLSGVLRHGDVDTASLKEFCESFLGPDGDLWTDQWVEVEIEDAETGDMRTEKQEIGVRSSHAVEWLSEIYGKDGTEQGKKRSQECLRALSEKWDPVRSGYWQYRVNKLEQQWRNTA